MLGQFSPYVFMGRAQRALIGGGVPVFAWHKVAHPPQQTTDPFLYASPEVFERQLAALRTAGFASVPLGEARGGQTGPPRKVVLTFDDGYVDVLENALPALSRHGFRATQFLISNCLGGRNEWDVLKGDVPERLMDATQVKAWLAAGMEIGSHSRTHPNLRRVAPAVAREEIFASKKSLEDRFGMPVRHFCYPYGAWNEAVRDLVREAGYETASTLVFGVNTPATTAWELRRIYPLSAGEILGKIRHRLARKLWRRRG